jgi:predicted nucleic acid-binding protein
LDEGRPRQPDCGSRVYPAIRQPVLDDLIQKARFWIGPDLYREVLAELGEE